MAFPNTTFITKVTVIARAWLQAVNDIVNYLPELIGASGTFLKSNGTTSSWETILQRETKSILDFGADNTGATSSQTALDAARAYAAGATNPMEILWPAGIYTYATSPNWGITNLKMTAQGVVRLRCTGTGNCFIVDAGATATDLLWNIDIGRFIIEGAATSGHGLYVRSAHHSRFSFNIAGCGTNKAGIRVEFAVCSTFSDPTVSNNEVFYGSSVPLYGISLAQRLAGETVSYCLFERMVIEGVTSHGVVLEGTLGNLFLGGTSEGVYGWGVYGMAGSNGDKFVGSDFEVNTLGDVYSVGTALSLSECDSTNYVYLNGSYASIKGGLYNTIELGTASRGTSVIAPTYYRFLGPPQPSPTYLTTASSALGSNTLTLNSRAILRGMAVIGTNIPNGTYVLGVAGESGCTPTTVRLSQVTTGIVASGASINFGYQTTKSTNGISLIATSRLYFASTTDLLVGMGIPIANSGIAANTYITAVAASYIDISNPLTAGVASGVSFALGMGVVGDFLETGAYNFLECVRNYNTTFNFLSARATSISPGSIGPLASANFSVTVAGVKVGDTVTVSMSYDASSFIVQPLVTATDTVKVTMFNLTGSAVDPGVISYVNVIANRPALF
tara:strand:+ start:1994 stop:3847 length:1854 start_codon:yes stop_codon:yes gene_type:complete